MPFKQGCARTDVIFSNTVGKTCEVAYNRRLLSYPPPRSMDV
jgi:hypothetical protein